MLHRLDAAPRAVLALLALLLVIAGCAPSSSAPAIVKVAPPSLISPTATAATNIYVAIGASDAFGIGTDVPAKQAWPVVLDRTLGVSYRLVDLGIPGATVELATRDELPIARDVQPQIITVWLAVNDFDAGVPLATYAQQLRDLLHALAVGTSARVYVANLPDLSFIPYFAGRNLQDLQTQIAAWNTAIAAACDAEGASLIDLYTRWAELASHPEYISSDGFHPSASGAARLAAIFAAVMLPELTGSASQQNPQQIQAGP